MTIRHPIISVNEPAPPSNGAGLATSGAPGTWQEDEITFESVSFANDGANPPESSARYLRAQDFRDTAERWQAIQSEFVDDPRRSVAAAHELVGELMQRIVDLFSAERAELEQQWAEGDQVSTEDLRICLQRYRDFFTRLVPAAGAAEHH